VSQGHSACTGSVLRITHTRTRWRSHGYGMRSTRRRSTNKFGRRGKAYTSELRRSLRMDRASVLSHRTHHLLLLLLLRSKRKWCTRPVLHPLRVGPHMRHIPRVSSGLVNSSTLHVRGHWWDHVLRRLRMSVWLRRVTWSHTAAW